MKLQRLLYAIAFVALGAGTAYAQFPPFMGGIPGLAQSNAIQMQRHQQRTLLYREALEELKQNPAAADVVDCSAGVSSNLCLVVAPKEPPVAKEGAPTPPGRRIAVLVGNNRYSPPIPKLETPVADVSRVAQVLQQKFGYETRMLNDAGKAQIVTALNAIALEAKPGDSVLVFYAGHGYLMDDTKMGYWIPVDASVTTAANWISNSDIGKLLKAIQARQLILVSDSCFSGSLTREGKFGKSLAPDAILRQRTVVALSSGGEEPVSDEGKNGHSVFAWNLIKTLEASGALTPGETVWKSVHTAVKKEAEQEPEYGPVIAAGHQSGGDFLFQPK